MDCLQCSELLYEYLDHLVDQEKEQEIKAHLSQCSFCQKELEEIRETLSLYKMCIQAPTLDNDFYLRVISCLEERENNPILKVPLIVAGSFLILITLLAFTLGSLFYPLLVVVTGLLLELLPVPFIFILAFPAAKLLALVSLTLILLLVTWIMGRIISY